MEQEMFPPLPDPAENQPPEARRAMGQRLIKQARHELESGDRLQAGGKAWGAAVQFLKIIGEQRGWGHESNRQLQSLGRHLAAEFPECGGELSGTLADAYFKGHENFYENRRRLREVREAVEGIEETIPILEQIAEAPPRPFTIASNSQLRRLRVLTGRNDLNIGDSSEVGFSLSIRYSSGGSEAGAVREERNTYVELIQPIVRRIIKTLLEHYPTLLEDEDLRNLQDWAYCRDVLGLRIANYELLRELEKGRIVNGHPRFWAKPYAEKYFGCSEWWRQDHVYNARKLQEFLSYIIQRKKGHPGISALQNHWRELNDFLARNQ